MSTSAPASLPDSGPNTPAKAAPKVGLVSLGCP